MDPDTMVTAGTMVTVAGVTEAGVMAGITVTMATEAGEMAGVTEAGLDTETETAAGVMDTVMEEAGDGDLLRGCDIY